MRHICSFYSDAAGPERARLHGLAQSLPFMVGAELASTNFMRWCPLNRAGTPAVPAVADSASAKRWSKARPFPGIVVAVEGLTAVRSAADKDTVRVEIELGESGLHYEPGDALGIYPQNCPEVTSCLMALGRVV